MRREPDYRSLVKPNGKIDYLALLRETPRLLRPSDYAYLVTFAALAVGICVADGIVQRGLVVAVVLTCVTPHTLRPTPPRDWIHLGVILALAAGAVFTSGIVHGVVQTALVACCWLRARRAARR